MITIDERDDVKVPTPDANQVTLFYTDQALRFKDESGDVYTLVKQSDLDAIEEAKPKVYRALLTQTGTDAPVAIVLENTLGGNVVWNYVGVGVYRIEAPNCALLNILLTNSALIFGAITSNRRLKGDIYDDGDGPIVDIYVRDNANVYTNILTNQFVEILVYP